jgi:hypothetical protein
MSDKYIYVYDKSGRLIRMNHFLEDRFWDYELYEMDNQKRRISSKRFYPDGKQADVHRMKYSDKPCQVRVTWQMYHDGKWDGQTNGALLKCDEQGRWTSRQMDIDDEPVTFEYDQYGNLVKILHCCKYNYWYVYENKLDKYENWIEREIIYYQKNDDGTETRRPETQRQFRVITYFGDPVENTR